MSELSEAQRATLRAICDTIVPSVARDDDPDGFWGRAATDLGVDAALEDFLFTKAPPEVRDGLIQLIEALGAQGFGTASLRSREQLLRNATLASTAAAQGVGALIGLTLFVYYGAPDPSTGRNVNWDAFGYPGPARPPAAPIGERLEPLQIDGDTTLDADVCIIGSGAGGGVVAGTLAAQGLDVVVLEAGGYFTEDQMTGYELWAYENLYWRGGPTPTADLNVSLMAGAGVGGGTVVNWTNCLRTTPQVRDEWAREGLEDVASPDYERHFEAVLERISGTTECNDTNGPHERIRAGADKLGWSWHWCTRNTDPSTYEADSAGLMGFGDMTGSKQSTTKTYLLDAFKAGARIVSHVRAERITTEGGEATGVEAAHVLSGAKVTVNAKHVVLAAGALESPAVLLRSGIGGPATGDYLRLHPSIATVGYYADEQRAWFGPAQQLVLDEFIAVENGRGFLIEGVHFSPSLVGSSVPWDGGEAHKAMIADLRHGATFVALARDHGHGRVVLDPASGEGIPFYPVDDPIDQENLYRGLTEMTKLHAAAGASSVVVLSTGTPTWRRGDDLAAFDARIRRIPLQAGGHRLFSAHQMGTCRMGSDPQTSVANPHGELHDTRGVWVGDASAFPTASGTNPMLSIMALARRTAEMIAQRAGSAVATPA